MKNEKKKLLSIHIDRKKYKSPSPTSGIALYELGSIDSDIYDLFRETHGHGDDEQIFFNADAVKLKNGDHFFSIKKKLNPGGMSCL